MEKKENIIVIMCNIFYGNCVILGRDVDILAKFSRVLVSVGAVGAAAPTDFQED